MTKFNYYHVDCGHFPAQIKLCFDNNEFQKILADHSINVKATALDTGIAETHYLTDGKEGIIVLVFDLSECDHDNAYLAGVVAHEATHCTCRVFEHIGEEPEDIGEESRAYLTEHIVKQIWKAIEVEKEKNVRERDRAVSKQKGKGKRGSVIQVDINSNGGSGSDSTVQQPSEVRGVKDSDGQTISASGNSVQGSGESGVSGSGNQK
jgi:hypothetical protein